MSSFSVSDRPRSIFPSISVRFHWSLHWHELFCSDYTWSHVFWYASSGVYAFSSLAFLLCFFQIILIYLCAEIIRVLIYCVISMILIFSLNLKWSNEQSGISWNRADVFNWWCLLASKQKLTVCRQIGSTNEF